LSPAGRQIPFRGDENEPLNFIEPAGSPPRAEQRRYPRYRSSLPVRLWLTSERYLFGRVVDISLHGLRLVRSRLAPADRVSPGEAYRVDLRVAPRADLRCVGIIRHARDDTVGVETREALPVERLSMTAPPTVT
jgi:PilZ domain-containing protein